MDVPAGFASEEEYLRWLASGENMPEPQDPRYAGPVGSLLKQFHRAEGMARTAIPDAVYGLGQLPDMIGAAADFGTNWALGGDKSFAEAMYGEQGVKNIEDAQTVQQRRYLTKLTPEEQADPAVQERLSAAVAGSPETYDAITENSPLLTKMARRFMDASHRGLGAAPPSTMTSGDELVQALTSAALPIGPLSRAIGKVASPAGRAALRTAEVLTPGSTSLPNAALNVGVEMGINQGARYLTDRPSAFTGDFVSGPAADPVEAEIAESSGIEMPSFGDALTTGMAAAGMTAAVLTGRMGRVRPNVVDDIPAPNAVTPPKSLPSDPTEPTPSTGVEPNIRSPAPQPGVRGKLERGWAEAGNKRRPVINKVQKATEHLTPDEQAVHQRSMERALHAGSLQEKAMAFNQAHDFGVLPGLRQPAATTVRQLKDMVSQLAPEEVKLWKDVHVARRYAHEQQLEIESLSERLVKLEHKVRSTATPSEVADLTNQINRVRGAIERRRTGQENLASGMSRTEYRALEGQAAANPKLKLIENAYRRISGDIDLSQVNLGHYTDMETLRQRQRYDYTMELIEDKWAEADWLSRAAGKAKQAFTGRRDMFRSARGADSSIGRRQGRSVKVDNPFGPMEMLERRLRDHINYTRDNEAIKEFMRQVQSSDEWGRSLKQARPPMTLSEFNVKPPKEADDPSVFAYTDGGKIHFVRSGDPALIRGLRNAPGDTIGAFDFAKRLWTRGTTGVLAPPFAVASAMNALIGQFTRGSGGFGYVHGALDRVFPNNAMVQKLIDMTVDPTVVAKIGVRALKDINAPLLRQFGEAVATDLANQSTLLGRLAQLPGGKVLLEKAGRQALLTYRNSTHLLAIKHGILGQPIVDPTFDAYARGMASIPSLIDSKLIPAPLRAFGQAWVHTFDAIRSSTSVAKFAQDLEKLERAYPNGVPKSKMDELVYDIKTFTGDMTRSPGSSGIAQTVSAVPFGSNIINSSAHFYTALANNPTTIGTRMAQMILPWVGMVAWISYPELNGNPELTEWYYNDLPEWQRVTTMPLPKPAYLARKLSGDTAPMTPDDVYLYKPPPELVPMVAAGLSVFRNLGLLGSYAERTQSPGSELLNIAASALVPPNNPLFASMGAIQKDQGGTGEAGQLNDPWLGEEGLDLIKSVFGTVTDMAYSGIDAGMQGYDHGGIGQAAKQAFSYYAYETERRLPEIIGADAGLFSSGKRRYYATTEQRQRVLNAYETVEPLYKKLGLDKRANRLEFPEQALRDPTALRMAGMIRQSMYSGQMNVLRKRRSDISLNVTNLDKQKGKMSPREYHTTLQRYHEEMADINDAQERIIRDLDFKLYKAYGTDIAGAVTYASQFVD